MKSALDGTDPSLTHVTSDTAQEGDLVAEPTHAEDVLLASSLESLSFRLGRTSSTERSHSHDMYMADESRMKNDSQLLSQPDGRGRMIEEPTLLPHSPQSSTNDFGSRSDATDPRRSRSLADIERVSYIMAVPRSRESCGSPQIMATQDQRVMQISPDYATAIVLPTGQEEQVIQILPQVVLSRKIPSRNDDRGISTPPRARSTSPIHNKTVPSFSEQVEGQEHHGSHGGSEGDEPAVAETEQPEFGPSGAPLLPHERTRSTVNGRLVTSVPLMAARERAISAARVEEQMVALAPTEDDNRDPNIEKFPESRADILKRIETLQTELVPDTSQLDEVAHRGCVHMDTPTQADANTPESTDDGLTNDSGHAGSTGSEIDIANVAGTCTGDGICDNGGLLFTFHGNHSHRHGLTARPWKSYGELDNDHTNLITGSKRSLSSQSGPSSSSRVKPTSKKPRCGYTQGDSSTECNTVLGGVKDVHEVGQLAPEDARESLPRRLWQWIRNWCLQFFSGRKQD